MVGVASLWTAMPAAAQSPDTTRITFSEAVNIALDQNTTLKRAANDVRRTDATLWQERLDWAPTASISSGVQRNFGRSFSQEEGGIVNEATDFFSINARSGVTLQGLGIQNWTSMRSAELDATSSQLSLERTRQDIVFQVMDRYITLVENREILVVQREELEARRQQLRQIQEFVDAGSRPISALYEQQALVAEAESAVLTAERDIQLTETRLIQTLRLDPMRAYDFEAPTVPDNIESDAVYQLESLMQQAFNQRLDVRASAVSVQAAKRDLRSTRTQYLPSLSFSADYGSNWTSAIPGPVGFFDVLDRRRGGSFGVSLSLPIFDGYNREVSIEQAQVSKLNAQYALEDQKLLVSLEVREAYLNYQNAVKQLDVSEKRLRFARQARDAAQERYNLGAASIVELTNANRTFVEAASQRIRARYNFLFQQKLIAYYVGSLNPSESLFQ
jgi:outer membrane protein